MIKKALIASLLTTIAVLTSSCMSKDIMETRQMSIENVDLAKVKDG